MLTETKHCNNDDDRVRIMDLAMSIAMDDDEQVEKFIADAQASRSMTSVLGKDMVIPVIREENAKGYELLGPPVSLLPTVCEEDEDGARD